METEPQGKAAEEVRALYMSTDRHENAIHAKGEIMSRKPSFANLRGAAPASVPTLKAGEGSPPCSPASRKGRKQIAGFFTPEMSLAMHMLARRQGRSLQALMAEAFDDVLRKYDGSPVGG